MLRKLLRLALVALLVGTVPIQALAALSIDVCNAVEHFDGHAQIVEAAHGDATSGAPMNGDHGPMDDAAYHSASCGVAAAIVARVIVVTTETPSAGVLAHPFRAPEGFVPDRPERPPLNLSL